MRRVNPIYFIMVGILLVCHVVTMVFPLVFSYVDMGLVVFLLIYDRIDEGNFIGLSVIFGFYSDYMRGGFFGPSVLLFLLFSYLRFKVDLMMDMSKFNSKILLFAGMAFIYTGFNVIFSGYTGDVILGMVGVRTAADMLMILIVVKIAGYARAAKNA